MVGRRVDALVSMLSRFHIVAGLAMVVLLLASAVLAREPLSDAQIRQAIIQESIARYQATGHPCACPYNPARNGTRCGGRSAYSRPGGAEPFCFPQDVSDGMVDAWRRAHPVGERPTPHPALKSGALAR
jgi:hypothetical protein